MTRANLSSSDPGATSSPTGGRGANVPYPSSRLRRSASKLPVFLWRLGLGPWLGRRLMIITTRGRKSGLPRRTAVEFHEFQGHKYVASGYGARADWYKNILADPYVTIQTAQGAESVLARRISDDQEFTELFMFAKQNPRLKRWIEAQGIRLDRDDLIAKKTDTCWITFNPTDEPTPEAAVADLTWVWAALVLAGALSARLASR